MSIPASLTAYVVALHVYDVSYAAGPGSHVGMPSTTLTFVLPLDEPLDVSWAGDPSSRGASWASVSGVHARPALIHHTGSLRGIQLALTTAGARVLFGVPASQLAGGLLDLADVDPAMADLPSRLADARSDDPVDVVWRTLTRALSRHDALGPRAEVGRALSLLTRGSTVSAVADEVGYSRRRLSTLVRDEVGVTPQELRRLGRFERSHAILRRRAGGGRLSISEVAASCGYADHAHLTREWGRLAGCSPTTWLATEFPNVQAIGA
ncbi:MAG: helix-turn-helix transcriptional regulator [Nocardioides sp.]|uniref:helix-turn-helix domain-containing protein n=1 Tax=Nocardioides sp. TaxID=35761 RepID=UPI003265FE27